jgi:hypothetical protein
MAVINRRNAVLGFGTWEAGKWYVRRKAKKTSFLGNVWGRAGAATVVVLAATGAIVFWKRSGDPA